MSPKREIKTLGPVLDQRSESQKRVDAVRAAAAEAYDVYQYRAGKPDHPSWLQLSMTEQLAWREVVATLWDRAPFGKDWSKYAK